MYENNLVRSYIAKDFTNLVAPHCEIASYCDTQWVYNFKGNYSLC